MREREFILIKYICKNCDDLISESSTCPVCGKRADIYSTEVFYCDHCNIPIFEEKCPVCGVKGKKIGSDVRPVFAQERLLLEVLLEKPMEFAGKSVWSTLSNVYWIDGEKLKIDLAELRKKDPGYVIEKLKERNENTEINDTKYWTGKNFSSLYQLLDLDNENKNTNEFNTTIILDNDNYDGNSTCMFHH